MADDARKAFKEALADLPEVGAGLTRMFSKPEPTAEDIKLWLELVGQLSTSLEKAYRAQKFFEDHPLA